MIEIDITNNEHDYCETIISEIQVTEPMIQAFNLSRMVKMLSLIDLLFALVFAMGNLFFFIPIFMPIVGFLGAVYYKKNYILSYFIFILGLTLTRAILYVYIFINLTTKEQNDRNQTIPILMISTIIELWISKIIYKFYVVIKKLSLLQITHLKISSNITNPRLILW